jgi:hypothetical protein
VEFLVKGTECWHPVSLAGAAQNNRCPSRHLSMGVSRLIFIRIHIIVLEADPAFFINVRIKCEFHVLYLPLMFSKQTVHNRFGELTLFSLHNFCIGHA